jgi:phosphatidylserine decarboxylase
MKIKVYDLKSNAIVNEKVYGESFIDFLYTSKLGRILAPILTHKAASRLYGIKMNSPKSKARVESFIKDYDIDVDKFVKTSLEHPGWNNFNEFFIRKYIDSHVDFVSSSKLPAFCEGRYFAWKSEKDISKLPIKGYQLNIRELLGDRNYESFIDGPALVCRLAPVDYHRFHFPDDCEIIDNYTIDGSLHSVNPLALARKSDILMVNERQVTILKSKHFGKLAMIEVGAVCVGKIVQTYKEKSQKRGSEKGYFKFGGSTVVLLGEKSKWSPEKKIIENTAHGIESLARLGQVIANGEVRI